MLINLTDSIFNANELVKSLNCTPCMSENQKKIYNISLCLLTLFKKFYDTEPPEEIIKSWDIGFHQIKRIFLAKKSYGYFLYGELNNNKIIGVYVPECELLTIQNSSNDWIASYWLSFYKGFIQVKHKKLIA